MTNPSFSPLVKVTATIPKYFGIIKSFCTLPTQSLQSETLTRTAKCLFMSHLQYCLSKMFLFACPRKAAVSGLTAGGLAQFIASPTDLVKVQMQMEGRRRLEGKPPRWGTSVQWCPLWCDPSDQQLPFVMYVSIWKTMQIFCLMRDHPFPAGSITWRSQCV